MLKAFFAQMTAKPVKRTLSLQEKQSLINREIERRHQKLREAAILDAYKRRLVHDSEQAIKREVKTIFGSQAVPSFSTIPQAEVDALFE